MILADPPWYFTNKDCKDISGTPPYKCMKDSEIANLPVGKIADKDSILLLWYPASKQKAHHVVGEAWGFEYMTHFLDWQKIYRSSKNVIVGMGYYTKQQSEYLSIWRKKSTVSARKFKINTGRSVGNYKREIIDLTDENVNDLNKLIIENKPNLIDDDDDYYKHFFFQLLLVLIVKNLKKLKK